MASVSGLPEKPHQPVEFNSPQRTFGYQKILSNPRTRGTRYMQLLHFRLRFLSTIALMMPTRRYPRRARIVTQKHCTARMHKSRDRPRPRQRLLARARPDRVRYASGAPAHVAVCWSSSRLCIAGRPLSTPCLK